MQEFRSSYAVSRIWACTKWKSRDQVTEKKINQKKAAFLACTQSRWHWVRSTRPPDLVGVTSCVPPLPSDYVVPVAVRASSQHVGAFNSIAWLLAADLPEWMWSILKEYGSDFYYSICIPTNSYEVFSISIPIPVHFHDGIIPIHLHFPPIPLFPTPCPFPCPFSSKFWNIFYVMVVWWCNGNCVGLTIPRSWVRLSVGSLSNAQFLDGDR